MDSNQLFKRVIPLLSTMTDVNKDLNRPYQLQEQDCSLSCFISNIPNFTRDVEAERKMKEAEAERKMRERVLRHKPKEKQKRQKVTKSHEKQENCDTSNSDVSGSSGYRSSLSSGMEEMYDVEKMIALDSECRFKREIKEKDEAIIRKAQEKKMRPKNQTVYERNVEILREKQNKAMEEAQIRELMKLPPIETKKEKAPKPKRVKWFEKCFPSEKEQKIAIKVTENPKEEIVKERQKCKSISDGNRHQEREKNIFGKERFQDSCKKMTYEKQNDSEDNQSEDVNEKREKKVSENDTFLNQCKQMAYENLEEIKKKDIAKDALEVEKMQKEMVKQEFAQRLVDKQEREKKVEMQTSLTNAWDGQVEFKRQKKIAMEKVKKQGSYLLMESERLRRLEETEKKQKKEKQPKLSTQDNTEQSIRDQNDDFQSKTVQNKNEMRLPQKVPSLEDCKKIVYDNLDSIKKKEAANFALLEEKRFKERAKQHLGQKVREEQEREKKANSKKSLTNTWDAQIQGKQQKKKEKIEIERQQMAAIIESDRLHQIEEVQMRREKKLKDQKFFRQDETEANTEDQKKMDDSLEAILRKEAAHDARLQKQLYSSTGKEKCSKMLNETDQRGKSQKQNPLADKLAATYERKQKQKSDMGRFERQGVLPGYRAEESRQKKEPQLKVKTRDNVTDKGQDVKYESVVDQDSDCDIPDMDRCREIHKKIVYDQLSMIQRKEADKRAFMEERLLKERKHREAAAQNREKLEKEKKAAATKSLTDSWDSQIQRKQQEKKELHEIERKDMLSLIELERVCGSENSKITPLEKQKQPVYHDVWKSLPAEGPGESSSKTCVEKTVYAAEKHQAKPSNVCRPLLSRQKVCNNMPARPPSLDPNCVYLHDDLKYTGVKLPFIPRPN